MNLPTREEVMALNDKTLVNAVAKAQGWSRCRRPKDYYNIRFDPKGRYWWTGVTIVRVDQYHPLESGYGFGHQALALIPMFKLQIEDACGNMFVWPHYRGKNFGFVKEDVAFFMPHYL